MNNNKILSVMEPLRVELFLDGANLDDMVRAYKLGIVSGFTTNPTLMRKAGITDYASFAKSVLKAIPDLSISFEVFSDEFSEMEREAREINSWGENTFIKVPVTNTKGESSAELIKKLASEGMALNVTAIFSIDQIKEVASALNPNTPSIVSVFAGRIADTGVDPVPMMREAKALLVDNPNAKLLWASPRELLNLFQANDCGCDVITATNDLIGKIECVGKDLEDFSLETVKMFHTDATNAGYQI